MYDFKQLTKFNLAQGSHPQPNANGDICINEAAVIAAGLEYRQIINPFQCPPCFSRVIAAYAMHINDRIPGRLRNGLLKPFVLRLAGTADSLQVEIERARLIVRRSEAKFLLRKDPRCQRWLKSARLGTCEAFDCHLALNDKAALKAASEAASSADLAAEAVGGWAEAVEILDAAIKAGRHQPLEDIGLVNRRLREARAGKLSYAHCGASEEATEGLSV